VRNFRPKHVELIEIVIVASSWLFILLLSVMQGQTNIKTTGPLFKSKAGQERSVTNYQSMLEHNVLEGRSHLQGDGSLKSLPLAAIFQA